MKRSETIKQFLILLFLSQILVSCEEKDCKAFDFSADVVGWQLFPDRQTEYIFESDSTLKVLERTIETVSKARSFTCGGGCRCNSRFHSSYLVDFTRFESTVMYDYERDRHPVSYTANVAEVVFDLDGNGNPVGTAFNGEVLNSNSEYELLDTFIVGDTTYDRVLHVIILEESLITEFWVAYGTGLIAYIQQEELFLKQ